MPNQEDLKEDIIQEYHDTKNGGHRGFQKTLELVMRYWWWRGISNDVREYVHTCDICQRQKYSTQSPAGLLQPLELPKKKWSDISMDFITSLPKTSKGYDTIMVVVDRATKAVHLTPMKGTHSAKDVAQLFYKNIWKLHGIPRTIVSDRDSKFTGKFWTTLMELLGTKLRMSSSHHPQTDGQTERINSVIEQTLRTFINGRVANWEDALPAVEYTLNNTVSKSTGYTPFYLQYGFHPESPMDLMVQHNEGASEAVNTWTRRMQKDFHEALTNLQIAVQSQVHQADKHRRHVEYKVGDQVLLEVYKHNTKGTARKLQRRYAGPFEIKRVISRTAYELSLSPTWTIHPVFHVGRLRPYNVSTRFTRRQVQMQPEPQLQESTGEFEVEKILDTRLTRGAGGRQRRQYLVLWKGYPAEDATWEPISNLTNCAEALAQYWREN